ncbi:hypothetical protein PENSPDRAFT_756001 [Peniophora sp. CONT]|nr:hypothetical protein PENSPDRAFT_756001 [Peniophora sp. CONT]
MQTGGLFYSLSNEAPVKWNVNQENTLLRDSAQFSRLFDASLTAASLTERVRGAYVQYLWLPEAIMPLSRLVPHLRKLSAGEESSSIDGIHPLHPTLDAILLTSRWCTYKHHDMESQEASQLDTGNEANLMAWALGKAPAPAGAEDESLPPDPVVRQLEAEQREVRIQILLHLLKLSLPGPCTSPPARPLPSSRNEQRRRRRQQTPESDTEGTPEAIIEERLEGLMDRLMLWQTSLPVEDEGRTEDGAGHPLRDWTQSFCDDIVCPEFAHVLPELCRILRAKVFRLPQWSEAEEEAEDTQIPAPALETNAAPPIHPFFRKASKKFVVPHDSSQAPSRSRSRSLSVSLAQEAQEEELRRATVHRSKRALDREWSTSRSFKGNRSQSQTQGQQVEMVQTVETVVTEDRRGDGPLVLVESTPRKPKKRARLDAEDDKRDRVSSNSAVLVNSTPVKARGRQETQPADEAGPYDEGGVGHGAASEEESN